MESLTFFFTASFYPPYHLGGDANHVMYLAEELARRGHEVHVLHSLDAYRVKRKRDPGFARKSLVTTHRIATSLSLSAYEAYLFGGSRSVTRQFHHLVKGTKPDVVHHHNISLLGYGILRRIGEYLNLYSAHDYWLICPTSNLVKRDGRICETASCKFCGLRQRRPPQVWRYGVSFGKAIDDIDFVIASCEYMKTRLLRKFPGMPVTLIRNFVPEPPKRIGPSGFSDFLLYAAMLERHKGILPLLESYEEFAASTGLRLVAAGEGTLRERVDKLIKAHGLESNVFPIGWVDHGALYSLLKDASALVIPSLWPENAPLVALDALSVGTPVVSSDRGGVPEIVEKLDRDLVFSWERRGDVQRAVRHSIKNQEYLRSRSLQVYREFFSAEVFLRSYMKLLSSQTARQ